MATPRPYSVRFIGLGGAGATYGYTVPAGYRAIITDLDGGNWGGGTAEIYIGIDALAFYKIAMPGVGVTAHHTTRQIAYSGERIVLQTVGSAVHACLSGYLLEDVPGGVHLPGAPAEEIEWIAPDKIPEVKPLPA